MLPNNRLSSTPVRSVFIGADAIDSTPDISYEDGGIALNDPSQGLLFQVWTAQIRNNGTQITIRADNHPESVLITGNDIREVSLAFDSNMRVNLVYLEGDITKLFWFDTSVGQMVTTEFTDLFTPRLSTDDKRISQSSNRDIIFAYIKNGDLFFRQQRDRYEIEYLLAENPKGKFVKFGMNRQLRLQFLFELPQFEPQAVLSISNDGRTYDRTQIAQSMGKIGEYNKRVIFRRLGQYDREFNGKITISAPVKRAIFAVYARVEPLNS